jgi:predicted nucleic acid-binding protein
VGVFAQEPAGSVRELIAAKALLTADESLRLAGGESVVKILPSSDKRAISVIGIVKVPSAQNIDLAAFRESLSQRGNADALDGGKFSVPPSVADLERLKLDDRDLTDMQRCVVGKCAVKLSAGMIEALRNAADSRQKAAEVYKRLLVEHVKAYLEKGDAGLPDYFDHKQPVRPSTENRLVLDASVFIKALAPDLHDYLRNYPNTELPGVDSRLDWTNVSSGLKPILTVTHTASYAKETPRSSILMIATKQIYASHYVDASLALSSLVRDVGADANAYLVFTSVSRSDALGGALSGIAHSIAEGEALRKVTDLVARAKYRLESINRPQAKIDEPEPGLFEQTVTIARNWLIPAGLVLAVAFAAILVFRRRRMG